MLKKFSIKSRLLLLILIPLMGSIIFGAIHIQKIYDEFSDASTFEKYISYLPVLSNVIHSLQKERAASTGYLKSENKNKFKKILAEQISNANEHLVVAKHIYHTLELIGLSPKATSILESFPDNVNDLINFRIRTISEEADSEAVYYFYSNLISSYITLIEELNWFNISAEINNSLMAYNYFMLWKENTGQERALGSGGFNPDNFNETKYHQYLLKMSEAKTFKNLFLEKSTTMEQSYVHNVLYGSESQEIAEIEKFIINNKLEKIQATVTGLQWYNLLSRKIDMMSQSERSLITQLLQQTNHIEFEKRNQLVAFSLMTTILFLAAIILSIKIASGISDPIHDIGQVMSNLRTGQEMSTAVGKIPHMDEANEIGHLSRQFSRMLATIGIQNKNLEKERDSAEAANNTKSDFLANMSHELRTPLNAIIGFSEVLHLNKEKTVEENATYLNYIHSSGEKLLLLVDNILHISSMSSGSIALKKDVFTLKELINNCFSVLNEKADQSKVTLKSNIHDAEAEILADYKRLKQVFINLLSNAIKFSSEDDAVYIDINVTDKTELSIVITDTGIGMDANEQKKSFQVFGQTEKGYSRSYDGVGLGLPLSRGIIEQHGGTLHLKSSPKIGTMVFIILPKECLIL